MKRFVLLMVAQWGFLSFAHADMPHLKKLALVNNTPQDIEFIFYWGNCTGEKRPPISMLLAKGGKRLLEYRDCLLKGFLVQTVDRKRIFMTDDAPACEGAGVSGYVLAGKHNFRNCWFSKGTGEITVRMPWPTFWEGTEQEKLPAYLKDTGSNLIVEWEID